MKLENFTKNYKITKTLQNYEITKNYKITQKNYKITHKKIYKIPNPYPKCCKYWSWINLSELAKISLETFIIDPAFVA